jgi:hypothetical protein
MATLLSAVSYQLSAILAWLPPSGAKDNHAEEQPSAWLDSHLLSFRLKAEATSRFGSYESVLHRFGELTAQKKTAGAG